MSQSDVPGARGRLSEAASSPAPATASERSEPAGRPAPASGSDVVLIHGPTEDQKGLRVLRAREQGIEVGEVRPLQEGKPLAGEIVKLRPRQGQPRICDVETQLSESELERARGTARPRLGHAGPPRVSSDAYRANWDAIYRSPSTPGSGELN